ncbi:MAG: ABC transporter ATP-binding protein [Bdellovibrionales bacterium]|nr:ABC transporter ATP-binding protein [Bdellovibrionales bacterium]
MIKCDQLSKKFYPSLFSKKEIFALQEISIEAIKGQTYALAGPNGSGKTTLLSCILGMYHPTSGSCSINNLHPQEAHSRINMGYLPENFSTYPDITPVEAIKHYALLSDKTIETSAVDEWLTKFDLFHERHRKIRGFSKGMIQRLGMVISLIHDPELIIWDEPSSGLDPEGRKLVLDLILEQKKKGKTIIVSSHILSDIERTCDHLWILKKGKLILDDNIHIACERANCKTVEELYLLKIQAEHI